MILSINNNLSIGFPMTDFIDWPGRVLKQRVHEDVPTFRVCFFDLLIITWVYNCSQRFSKVYHKQGLETEF